MSRFIVAAAPTLVLRLARSRHSDRQISRAQPTMEKIKYQPVELKGQLRIVANTLISHKCMRAVYFMPTELRIYLVQPASTVMRPSRGMCGSCRPHIINNSPLMSLARSSESSFIPLPRLPLCMSVA